MPNRLETIIAVAGDLKKQADDRRSDGTWVPKKGGTPSAPKPAKPAPAKRK